MTTALTTTTEPLPEERMIDGQPVDAWFDRIQTTLAGRISAGHAALFARPERLLGGIEWHSCFSGPAAPLTKIDVVRRAAVQKRLEAMLKEVRLLADRVTAEGSDGRRLGRILRTISEVPPLQLIWLVGEQPVIVGWSHQPPPTVGVSVPIPIAIPIPTSAPTTAGTPGAFETVRGLGAAPPAPNPATIPGSSVDADGHRYDLLIFAVVVPAILAMILMAILLLPNVPWPTASPDRITALSKELAALDAAAETCTTTPPSPNKKP